MPVKERHRNRKTPNPTPKTFVMSLMDFHFLLQHPHYPTQCLHLSRISDDYLGFHFYTRITRVNGKISWLKYWFYKFNLPSNGGFLTEDVRIKKQMTNWRKYSDEVFVLSWFRYFHWTSMMYWMHFWFVGSNSIGFLLKLFFFQLHIRYILYLNVICIALTMNLHI